MTLIVIASALLALGWYFNQHKSGPENTSKNSLTAAQASISKTPIEQVKEKVQDLASHDGEKNHSDHSNENEAAELLTQERQYTEIELNEMTEEKFEALLKDTQMRLPKLSDFKKLPAGALHRTPPQVIEAGRNLGVIKEVLRIHESYERAALPFYRDCAKNDEGSTPVRALCLTNLIEIHKKNNVPLNLKEYPSQLIELTKLVTDI